MKELIITSGNSGNFIQIQNFVISLKNNGLYKGEIVVCDNQISGTWDNPGTWQKEGSFNEDQLSFFKSEFVKLYSLDELISENELDKDVIKNIKSPTQRYPYKFIYNTLISKKYIHKVDKIIYFDSDVFFQADVAPLFNELEDDKITLVKEWLKMKESYFLHKWLKYSDFKKLSNNDDYLDTMLNADNFCSGMYGANAITFHRFNLMALLLTSNQFINFYSDQPLINILKTYFKWPFKEISFEYCLHLGELKRDLDYKISAGQFFKGDVLPICIHFNGNKYFELEAAIANQPLEIIKNNFKLQNIILKIMNKLSL